ncbi:HEAT repeat domain-containing protein [Mesorhizobium sp. LNJC394B00]|uniref:HEAT repeat domain-containing protein n=1 Tax=Mesorhizobium sp. LNJC394B00 TaxID=1287274 RepID=UPI000A050499|nr:HEAT repeat domain-containing protein [Mesorhizobium sp. LNJC394B00]
MASVATQLFAPPRRIAAEVVRQHVEQAAFLWAQRDTWSLEDPPDEAVIAEIGQRLEINLDGLRIAGSAAWPFVDRQLEDFPDKGEFFVAGWMAIEQGDAKRVESTIDAARQAVERRGLAGALSWHKPQKIGKLVRDWLGAHDALLRYLGVAACAAHDVDPKQLLRRLVRDPDADTRALSLRLAGRLKRTDLAQEMEAAMEATDDTVRLWAGWALSELGFGDLARTELRKAATAGSPDALPALRATVKAGPEKEVRAWLGGLMRSSDTAPVAVRGIGMLVDRSVLPWLIERMREPHVAEAACAAFLELYPEAREETKLFTVDPAELGPESARRFGDQVVRLALPDNVGAWCVRLSQLP